MKPSSKQNKLEDTINAQPNIENYEQKKHKKYCPRRLADFYVHSIQCRGCSKARCLKMRSYRAHKKHCQLKTQAACSMCKKLSKLRRYHIRHCQADECPVFNCTKINIRRQLSAIEFRETELLVKLQELGVSIENGMLKIDDNVFKKKVLILDDITD